MSRGLLTLIVLLALAVGCAEPVAETPVTTEPPGSKSVASAEPTETVSVTEPKRKRTPVQLGGATTAAGTTATNEQQTESVLSAMQPLQVLLGKWNGTSRKAQLDQPEWVWDFQSDRNQPALLIKSDKGTYIREGRLTYLPATQQYRFQFKSPEGTERSLIGTFIEPVQDVPGDDKKLQRTYKLKLAEAQPGDAGEQWQVAIQQLENSRYLIELDRRRGTGPYQRIDTIHSQREGTSFALSDSDYGEKTCIISQGLGTMTVSYQGKS
ncbi:MAG TPA: hypothetical protein VM165_21725 [Planctomycetaceae bacterium]|nr:hypothetical protein [Planctomycetaceae bacterium]